MTWIEINLPYSDSGDPYPYPERPDLSEREREVFGASENDLWEEHQDAIDKLHNLIYDEIEIPEGEDDNEWHYVGEYVKEHPEYAVAYEAQTRRRAIREWREKQPEWLAWEKASDESLEADKLKTFVGRGLTVPGVQIELADGRRFLLGDTNCVGGVCDDCTAFEGTDVVTRYRVLLTPETLAG